ncbi:MAG: hypothetical protein ACI8ZB_004188 [Desulforhopalus sp.]|jgi:hypothetical protein
MRIPSLIITFFLALLVASAQAQETSSEQVGTGTSTDTLTPAENTTVDRVHSSATGLIRNTIGKIDSLFVDDYYTTFGDNSTRVRLRLDSRYVQDHGFDVKGKLKFKLVLPGLGKGFRLVMNDDDSSDDDDIAKDDGDDNDVALRYVLMQQDNSALSFDAGLRVKSGDLDPFLRFNAAIQYDIIGQWYGRTSNRLYYYSKTHWRNDFRQSFNRPLTDDLLFKARTRLQYYDENDYNPFIEQKFSLFQTLDSKSAIAYEALWLKQAEEDSVFDEDEIIGDLQDSYQNVGLRLRYRRNVWREWLYVELWPIVGWAEERDWDTVLAGFFRLEVTFGGKGKSRLSE